VIAQRTHPSAQTGKAPVAALALKGAVAVLHALLDVDPLPESIVIPPACLFTSKARSDLWHAVARGDHPLCEVRSAHTDSLLRVQRCTTLAACHRTVLAHGAGSVRDAQMQRALSSLLLRSPGTLSGYHAPGG
jgi:hypothetical protein